MTAETTPPNIQPISPEKTGLIALLFESFAIVGRYFVLSYPLFLFLLLVQLLTPKGHPDWQQPALWVLLFGFVVLHFLFQAGWSVMNAKAVENWQTLKQQNEVVPTSPFGVFGLFRYFFEGVGQFGLSFVGTGMIVFVLTAGLILAAIWYGITFVGFPDSILKMIQQGKPVLDIMTYLDKLPEHSRVFSQLRAWDSVLLPAILASIVVSALTLYWPQFVVLKSANPFKALWTSAFHILTHPLDSLMILFLVGSFELLALFFSGASGILSVLGLFLFLMMSVVFQVFFFLYLKHRHVSC